MNDSLEGLVKLVISVAVVTFACLGGAACADDSVITVRGEVVAEPCTVASNSANMTIDFGRVSAKDMQTAGNATNYVYPSGSSNISLSSCPAGTRTVTAKFIGTPDPNDSTLFKNTGTASNLGIWLVIGGSHTAITPGSTRTATVTNSAASFNVAAKLYTKNGGVTAGTVSATISVALSYQ